MRNTLSGLMSRCTTPAWWAACSASPTCQAMWTARRTVSCSSRTGRRAACPRAAPSRSRRAPSRGSSTKSATSTMCSWLIWFTARASLKKRATDSRLLACSGLSTFRATRRPRVTWLATKTRPMPPSPMRFDRSRSCRARRRPSRGIGGAQRGRRRPGRLRRLLQRGLGGQRRPERPRAREAVGGVLGERPQHRGGEGLAPGRQRRRRPRSPVRAEQVGVPASAKGT